jgi:hypothetical protein
MPTATQVYCTNPSACSNAETLKVPLCERACRECLFERIPILATRHGLKSEAITFAKDIHNAAQAPMISQ